MVLLAAPLVLVGILQRKGFCSEDLSCYGGTVAIEIDFLAQDCQNLPLLF